MRRGLVEADALIDLNAILELKQIKIYQTETFIGAGVILRQVIDNTTIADLYPAVVEASASIAGPSHREAATVGGNLCLDTRCLYYNQSHWWRKSNDFCLKYRGEICHVAPNKKQCRAAFSGDLAPALMVHGAQVEIAGPQGRRRMALEKFYREDGIDFLRLEAAEILVGIYLKPAPVRSGYSKIRLRGAIDFPLAGVAIACEKSGSNTRFKIAITGTNSCPIMVETRKLLGPDDDRDKYFSDLAKSVEKAVTPLRTTIAPANYRRVSIGAAARKLAAKLDQQLSAG